MPYTKHVSEMIGSLTCGQASVSVENQIVSKIGKGILVFAAVGKDDTTKEAESMAGKLLRFKMWDNWKKSVKDVDGEVLCVSQFTLLASTKKGNKPDFHKSASGEKAREIYDHFVTAVQEQYRTEKVKDGVFQAMMVSLESALVL